MRLYILINLFIGLVSCSNGDVKLIGRNATTDSIMKIEMSLSAFGVESDDFPSIEVFIDFTRDTSTCVKSYFNPAYKGLTYSLTKSEILAILELIKTSDFKKLKDKYTVNKSDQPRSTTKIYTVNKTFIIDDYGLEGESPLTELYKIAYKIY